MDMNFRVSEVTFSEHRAPGARRYLPEAYLAMTSVAYFFEFCPLTLGDVLDSSLFFRNTVSA